MHGDQFSQESTGERHFKLFSCMHAWTGQPHFHVSFCILPCQVLMVHAWTLYCVHQARWLTVSDWAGRATLEIAGP